MPSWQRLARRALGFSLHVGLAATSVAIAILTFELLARSALFDWAPPVGDRRFWQYDPLLGWRHARGMNARHRHADFDVEVQINSDGLRDRTYPIERTPGVRRILVLGDSFGWGFGVEQEEVWTELIEGRHPDTEIVNASVSGYGTDQQLLWWREEGLAFRPDIVLLLFHPNDFLDNHRYSRYGYRKPLFALRGDQLELTRVPVPRSSPRSRLKRWLYRNSYLYPRVRELPDLIAEALEGLLLPEEASAEAPGAEPGDAAARQLEEESEQLRITHFLLRELAASVRESGARFVVASVLMAPHLRVHLEETLAELDVPHLTLDAAFRAHERAAVHFEHDPHWNASGHVLAAREIERFLVSLGILGPPQGDPGAGSEGPASQAPLQSPAPQPAG